MSSGSQPRVVLTVGSAHGRRILQRLYERGIAPNAVLIHTGGLAPPPAHRHERLPDRLWRWPRSAVSGVRRDVRFRRYSRAWFAERAPRVVATGDVNSGRLQRDLERLAPDYLVLGGGGLILPRVIATASRGVLNAHPALLPWMRGCGVMGHSLEQGVAMGATVHHVDAGIDTGPAVERRLLQVSPGPASLAELEAAAMELAAVMMAEVIEDLVRHGREPRGVPQQRRFPLYSDPPAAERAVHEELAATGRAFELFELWRPLCTSSDSWALPAAPFEAPR
ncbi:MAG: formyltransferase family protein [Thermoleophilaceae bacterium]